MRLNRRVRGIIIKDGKILIIHRIKNGEEYYLIPGGGIEDGETIEQTLIREIKEETNQDITDYSKLFEFEFDDPENDDRKSLTYYLIDKFTENDLKITGPELERHSEQNQYLLEWWTLEKFFKFPHRYRQDVMDKLKDSLTKTLKD